MTTDNNVTPKTNNTLRLVIIGGLIVAAFLGAYQFAQARSATKANAGTLAPAQTVAGTGLGAAADPATDPAAAGCSCCGSTAPTANGLTGDPVEGAAKVAGDVQTISVDLSQGYYNPNVIVLKAGVPAEITFGQSQGCTGQVLSKDLDFFEDLTTGAKTVKLGALEPGEYAFSCGMEMVFGKIVVE